MKVSVLITSYNHAPTLKRAIDGVLVQKTNFDFHIVIVDDGSTDGSISIIKDYFQNTKLWNIGIIQHMENMGIMATYRDGFERCNGKYTAICDCDDYWIDPLKLQKQVDYMDAHPDCGICYTRVKYENPNGTAQHQAQIPSEVTYDRMLRGGYIWSMSMMFRTALQREYAPFDKIVRRGFFIWDYPIYLALLLHSKVHYLPDITAVYVQHNESFSNTRKRYHRLKYVMGLLWIKVWYILHYGCSWSTLFYVIYRFVRDIYSIIFKRWYR